MESKKNLENNNIVNPELMLEEFIRKQQTQAKSINDLATTINFLSNKIISFEKKISKPIPVSTNVQSIQEMIKRSIDDIKIIVSTQQQKPIVKKFQL